MPNILDLYSHFGLSIQKVSSNKGGEFAGPCPGCGGNDRFRIWPEDNNGEGSFWCRQPGNGCGKGGDAIQFLREFRGLSYKQACKELDKPAGDSYATPAARPKARPQKSFTPAQVDHPAGVDAAAWQKRATDLAAAAHKNLMADQATLAWLQTRGIDAAAARKYHLGLLPDNYYRPRTAWGLPETKNNGRPVKLFVPAGLVIPHRQGDVVIRLRIRRADDAGAEKYGRYYAVPGSNMQPWSSAPSSLDPIKSAWAIVETELDGVMIDCLAGDLVIVAAIGSVSVKPDAQLHRQLERALAILVSLDRDDAGVSAWAWWSKQYRRAKYYPVPENYGKDPGEAYAAGLDIVKWLKSGLPPIFRFGPCPEKAGAGKGGRAASKPPPPKPAAPKPAPKKPEADRQPVIDALDQLQQLLKNYPVSIICTKTRLGIEHNENWHNDRALGQISRLVFFNSEIFDYLHDHPAELITADNLMKGIF